MMATISNNLCCVIHRKMIHRFRVQVLQNPPFCSSTLFSTETIWWLPSTASWRTPWTFRTGRVLGLIRIVRLSSPPSWIMCSTPTPVGCEAALHQLYCSTSRYATYAGMLHKQVESIPQLLTQFVIYHCFFFCIVNMIVAPPVPPPPRRPWARNAVRNRTDPTLKSFRY